VIPRSTPRDEQTNKTDRFHGSSQVLSNVSSKTRRRIPLKISVPDYNYGSDYGGDESCQDAKDQLVHPDYVGRKDKRGYVGCQFGWMNLLVELLLP